MKLQLCGYFLGVFATLPVASDVMPHCGGPTVSIQSPGQDCGHHGPRWRGDCRAPAACFVLDHSGPSCTVECKVDEDCTAKLGAPGFTCTGQGTPYANTSEHVKRSLCLTKQQNDQLSKKPDP